jgi:F0F1-type ATP synthase membrane subunit a
MLCFFSVKSSYKQIKVLVLAQNSQITTKNRMSFVNFLLFIILQIGENGEIPYYTSNLYPTPLMVLNKSSPIFSLSLRM